MLLIQQWLLQGGHLVAIVNLQCSSHAEDRRVVCRILIIITYYKDCICLRSVCCTWRLWNESCQICWIRGSCQLFTEIRLLRISFLIISISANLLLLFLHFLTEFALDLFHSIKIDFTARLVWNRIFAADGTQGLVHWCVHAQLLLLLGITWHWRDKLASTVDFNRKVDCRTGVF